MSLTTPRSKAGLHPAARPPGPWRARLSGRAGVAVAVGGILSLYLATRIAFVDGFPPFSDEGTFALLSAKASRARSDLFISLTIGHPPLHAWLGIPWIKLGVDPITAMRIVSVLAGLLTVAAVALLARRLGGTAAALAAAGLCVVMPFYVVHHGIGIMEAVVTSLMAAALYVQVELARRPGVPLGAVLGLVLAAALLTKENTKPALALVPLSLLCFDWSPEGRRERLVRWVAGIGVAAIMVVGAQLLLHASSRYPQLEAARNSPFYTVRTVGEVLSDPFASWGKAWSAYRPAFAEYVTLPLLAAAAAGALTAWRRWRGLTALLLAWIAVPFGISMSFATFPFPRHVMYITPPAIVLMGVALVAGGRWLARSLSARVAAGVGAAALVVVLAPAIRVDWRLLSDPAAARYPGLDDAQYVTSTGGGAPWHPVADVVRRRARGDRVVVLHPDANPERLRLLLDDDARYVFVRGDSPLAPSAQFAIRDYAAPSFVDRRALAVMRQRRLRLLGRFPRPRGGVVVRLYGR
jgi:4-amino-4-deoxy-L-arabinose transferase-like glycosyltransferase